MESERKWSCSVMSDCDPVDCSPQGSSVHGMLQARILEWGAISFSRGSFQLRDRIPVSRIAGRRFILWATREAKEWKFYFKCLKWEISTGDISTEPIFQI